MARRCTCSRLMEALRDDPRLRTLPLATRMLWLLLAEAMARPGFDGVLPYSDPRRVSLLVSEMQTEVETHLETLVGEGLIQREGDTLVIPMLREVSARTAANRQNARNSGRPRKGETPEQAYQRRQREMMLPIEGGSLEKPNETERWETPSAGAAPRATSSSSEKLDSLVHREAWVQLAKEVIASAGLVLRRPDFTPARAWLEAGASRELVLQVVADVMGGVDDRGKVYSLNFFNDPIKRAIHEGAVPTLQRQPVGPVDTAHQEALQRWHERGCVGPAPVRRAA